LTFFSNNNLDPLQNLATTNFPTYCRHFSPYEKNYRHNLILAEVTPRSLENCGPLTGTDKHPTKANFPYLVVVETSLAQSASGEPLNSHHAYFTVAVQ